MRVHYFQHVAFEGLGCIETWLLEHGHTITVTRFYQEDPVLPDLNQIDALIILGGPMCVYDDYKYPWLQTEKAFIEDAITEKKKVLGICLGAQLIAIAMGTFVNTAPRKEIGWYPVYPVREGISWIADLFTDRPVVFHWHGDQFEVPYGGLNLLRSEGNQNQAFSYQDHVLALQFHAEVTAAAVTAMLTHGTEELIPVPFVQAELEILDGFEHLDQANELMYAILRNFI
ncbi:amidotransferase [Pedobacter lusitanus]|uniref:Amidotransferase n=1 Tax=Pedobacter lusitanus TaxID=1503925 RepID=A0A0D0F4V0_9SPHI|nr:type 1 glutamine amidotransferase [Pedobacter lusitanus]KIO76648.1 amidotransferase [Pedobacter lusitanus]